MPINIFQGQPEPDVAAGPSSSSQGPQGAAALQAQVAQAAMEAAIAAEEQPGLVSLNANVACSQNLSPGPFDIRLPACASALGVLFNFLLCMSFCRCQDLPHGQASTASSWRQRLGSQI
jgi:hypothetical protein